MAIYLKDLLKQQAYYMFRMGKTMKEVLELCKNENLTPDEQESFRVQIQKTYYSNEQDSDY